MPQSSATAVLQSELVGPMGIQKGEEYLWFSSHQSSVTSYGECKGAQDVKT